MVWRQVSLQSSDEQRERTVHVYPFQFDLSTNRSIRSRTPLFSYSLEFEL